MDRKNNILFVCLGNICRSPMAQSIMQSLVDEKGLTHNFSIDSVATSREEIGNIPHRGTADILRNNNIPLIPHRARQITREDYDRADYVIAMDESNKSNIKRVLNLDNNNKISLLLDYTDRQGESIADPWYTGNFVDTYRDCMEGCRGLLDFIIKSEGDIL